VFRLQKGVQASMFGLQERFGFRVQGFTEIFLKPEA
jgi:hypothetical protein